jgi:hypothetical protein
MSGVITALKESIDSNPLKELTAEETHSEIVKFSSFCSIIHNKKLNDVAIFSLIIRKPIYKKIFMKIIHVDNEKKAILIFLKNNTNLCRSKIVKDILKFK